MQDRDPFASIKSDVQKMFVVIYACNKSFSLGYPKQTVCYVTLIVYRRSLINLYNLSWGTKFRVDDLLRLPE